MDLTLGKFIRRRRKNLKYTIRRFAEITGLSISYLSELENDKYLSPSFAVMIKISEALWVSYTDLAQGFQNSQAKKVDVINSRYYGLVENSNEIPRRY